MSGRTLTSSLIVRLVDQATRPARSITNSLLGIQRAGTQAGRVSFGDRLAAGIRRNDAALANARGGLVDAVAGFYALRTAIAAPVREAMLFESGMADVKKVVDDFDTRTEPGRQAFESFKNELVELSKEVPLTVNELAAIAAAAGETGIAGDQLVEFTRTAAIAATAFGMTADQVKDVMFNLGNTFKMSVPEMAAFNDTVNHISNSMAANAPAVLDFTNRAAGAADFLGLSVDQLAGFGAALIAAGVKSETAGRGVTALATRIRTDARGVDETLQKIGLSTDEMRANLDKDGDAALLKMFQRLSDLPLNDQAEALKALAGQDFSDDFAKLLKNPDLLRQGLDLSNDIRRAGSAFREFQVRAETFENSMQIFNNRLTAMKVVIGAALIPAINKLMDAITPVIERVTQFAQAHPELISNVLAAAAGMIAFRTAIAGLKFVGLLGRGGALHLLSLGFNTIGRASIGATRAARNMVGLQTALAGFEGKKLTGLQKVGAAARGMLLAVPSVGLLSGVFSTLATAVAAVGAAIAGITAPVWGAIAAAVLAVAAAGYTLWRYWDRITSVLSGVARRIGEELQPALDAIKPVLEAIEPVTNAVSSAFTSMQSAIGSVLDWFKTKWEEFKSWIGGFFQQEVLTEDDAAALEQRGYDMADRVINAIKSVFSGFSWLAVIPVLRWRKLIAKLAWKSFITPLKWGAYIATFRWATAVPKLAWSAVITPLKWAAMVPKLSWSAFVGTLKWAGLVGKLSWSMLITPLKWGARLIPVIGWAALVGELAWNLIIKPLGWDKFLPKIDWSGVLGAFSWESWIPTIDWDRVFGSISWPEPPKWLRWLMGEEEAKVPSFSDAPGYAALSPERQQAALKAESLINAGPLPTQEYLVQLDLEDADLRAKIASIEAEIATLGPSMQAAPLVADLEYARETLALINAELAMAERVPNSNRNAVADLRADAEAVKAEIADLEFKLSRMPGPSAGHQEALEETRAKLEAVVQKQEDATARASELQSALMVVGELDVAPQVDATSIDAVLQKALKLQSTLAPLSNTGASAPASAPLDGARASGGPVDAGGTYLVGEQGPELVRFGRSGFVHNARETMTMLRGMASQAVPKGGSLGIPNIGGMISGVGNAVAATAGIPVPVAASGKSAPPSVNLGGVSVTIHGVQDIRGAAGEIGEIIEAELSQLLRGAHADGAL